MRAGFNSGREKTIQRFAEIGPVGVDPRLELAVIEFDQFLQFPWFLDIIRVCARSLGVGVRADRT
jgi:hypothetical protein